MTMDSRIKIELNEKYHFNKVTVEEGYVLTTWKEDGDIKEYSSSTQLFTPVDATLDEYRVISSEEDAALLKQQEDVFKEEEAERNKPSA